MDKLLACFIIFLGIFISNLPLTFCEIENVTSSTSEEPDQFEGGDDFDASKKIQIAEIKSGLNETKNVTESPSFKNSSVSTDVENVTESISQTKGATSGLRSDKLPAEFKDPSELDQSSKLTKQLTDFSPPVNISSPSDIKTKVPSTSNNETAQLGPVESDTSSYPPRKNNSASAFQAHPSESSNHQLPITGQEKEMSNENRTKTENETGSHIYLGNVSVHDTTNDKGHDLMNSEHAGDIKEDKTSTSTPAATITTSSPTSTPAPPATTTTTASAPKSTASPPPKITVIGAASPSANISGHRPENVKGSSSDISPSTTTGSSPTNITEAQDNSKKQNLKNIPVSLEDATEFPPYFKNDSVSTPVIVPSKNVRNVSSPTPEIVYKDNNTSSEMGYPANEYKIVDSANLTIIPSSATVSEGIKRSGKVAASDSGNNTEPDNPKNASSTTAAPSSESVESSKEVVPPPSSPGSGCADDEENSIHQFFQELKVHTLLCLFSLLIILLGFSIVFFFLVAIFLLIKYMAIGLFKLCKKMKKCASSKNSSHQYTNGIADSTGSLFPRCDVNIRAYDPSNDGSNPTFPSPPERVPY